MTGFLLGEAALLAGVEVVAAAPETGFARSLLQAVSNRLGSPVNANLHATAASALEMAGSLAGRGCRTLLATNGTGLRAAAEQLALAQAAGHPVVLAHCQQVSPDASAIRPCDADVALACHLGLDGQPLPVLAVADRLVLPAILRRAFDQADCLQMPVIVLLSTHLAVESAAAAANALQSPPCAVDAIREVTADIDAEAHTLLISYGAADSAAREAVTRVRAAGVSTSHLTIHELWPLPEDSLRRAITPLVTRLLVPECNQGQYARELSRVVRNLKVEPLACLDAPAAGDWIIRRLTEWPCG